MSLVKSVLSEVNDDRDRPMSDLRELWLHRPWKVKLRVDDEWPDQLLEAVRKTNEERKRRGLDAKRMLVRVTTNCPWDMRRLDEVVSIVVVSVGLYLRRDGVVALKVSSNGFPVIKLGDQSSAVNYSTTFT